MSDTPRTNALLTAILDSDGFLNETNAPERWVNLCREIEHDCDEARKSLDFQTKFNYELNEREKRTHEENCKLRAELDKATRANLNYFGENAALTEEVERLKADKEKYNGAVLVELAELKAEVERLKSQLEQAEAMVGCYKADKARPIDAAMKGDAK